MPNDLDPASSVFTTTGMFLLPGEGITDEFLQNAVDNGGFNFLGTSLKPSVSFGVKTIGVENADATTITFSSDKTDGVDAFSGTSYVVFLQQVDSLATYNTNPLKIRVNSRTTTTFQVTAESTISAGGVTASFMWIAFGI